MDRPTTRLLVLLLVFSLCIRLPFVGVPLERDEGVRAVIAQGMLDGQLPYADLYTNKPPGVLFIYALIFSLLGTSVEAIHLGLYLFSLAAVVLLFVLGLRLTGSRLAAFVAAFAFSVTSMSPRVYGTAANLEQFMALPIVLGALLLWRGLERRSLSYLFLSGACAGGAMLIKQAGVFTMLFLLGVAAYELLALRACTLRRFALMTLALVGGAALVLGAALLYPWARGILGPALRWTFVVTLPYVLEPSFSAPKFLAVTESIVGEHPLVYALAAIGLGAALARPSRTHGILLSWTVLSACSLLPGMRFIRHYYILLLLPVSLASGIGARVLLTYLAKLRAPALRAAAFGALAVVAIVFPVRAYMPYVAAPDADAMSRLNHPYSFFPEARTAGAYIGRRTTPEETILVAGNEPEIYHYAQRRSATRHIGFFYLFKGYAGEGAMQREAYDEILRNNPAYIVRFYGPPSFEIEPGADTYLLRSLDQLVSSRYALDGIGVCSTRAPAVRRCELGKAARGVVPGRDERVFMHLFRRVDER